MRSVILVIAAIVAIAVNIIQFQRSCEPRSVGQCFADWLNWAKSSDDPRAAADREKTRKANEQARLDAIEAKRQADEIERQRKQREEDAEIERRRLAAIEEQARRDKEAAARAAADEQRRKDEELRRQRADQERQAAMRQQQIEQQQREEQRRQQLESERRATLERMRCGSPQGRYFCCALGQTPDVKTNPQPRTWNDLLIFYCRQI